MQIFANFFREMREKNAKLFEFDGKVNDAGEEMGEIGGVEGVSAYNS